MADTKDVFEIIHTMRAMRRLKPDPVPDALIRKIRRGRVATVNELRVAVAKKHGATIGCPITTGIFSWIAAHAAAEDEAAGRKRITPWWRVLKEGKKLNPKFPGGVSEHARRLRSEGHTIRNAKLVS